MKNPPFLRTLRDEGQAREFLSRHIDPATGCAEIRILGADLDRQRCWIIPTDKFPKTVVGYFTKPDAAIDELRSVFGLSAYVTANPINPALLARADNRLVVAGWGGATQDVDVVCLRRLYIDIDAKRPAGISSTDDELAATVAVRDRILAEHPELAASALWGRSGNGCWILVRLPDYPNDANHEGLIGRALEYLSARYSGGTVEIDVKTKNPSRIMCLPGTLKCKGDSIPERPWRPATIDGGQGVAL